MRVVLLCGGVGKRMPPIIRDKSLLKFTGKPLILQQIDVAVEAGLKHFVIIANPENITELKPIVASIPGIATDFVIQQKALGIADALLSASSLLAKEPFILVNSNDIFEASAYTQLLSAYHKNSNYSCYITARPMPNYFPGGYLVVNADSKIHHIVEKPPKGEEPSQQINIVIHLHNQPQKLLEYLAKTESATDDVYERALDQMIQDGLEMKAVTYNGDWQAIKYPWHILDAMDYFLSRLSSRISSTAQISDKAVIDGNPVIEDNVRVLEGAVIRGPCYIGRNSVIGNGVLLRDSTIGNDCVVGYSTEVKHSYIGDNCWFHSNYIGDSVIDDDCSFGAGTVLANFRLDEANVSIKIGDEELDTGHDKLGAIVGKGCRTGINASIMPGIRVGPNSFVGPHVCLTGDLEANKMALTEPRYRILPNETKLVEDKRQELLRKLIS